MISTNEKTKGALKLQNQKNLQMQQKEETLKNVLNTVKQNPKFIKLLVYSLNSLESFVSPPNRDIKVNAKIIIKLEGVGILKAIASINLTNEAIVDQTGTIIWKIISINDFIDQELAKLFADTHGHEAVIEILLCKQKGEGAKPYIKVLNGMVQVPQLVQKLIESGLIETVKLVNDIYVDDQDIITLNFDTMKKISNLKMGREILIKKNLIPNLIKNIKISATQKDPKAVISGFSIVDNISRSDSGKEALKNNNAIENISQILDFFENDDRVLKMGAKIYSKISKPEDMIKEIEYLETIYFKQDYSDLKELEKSLVLISNFMLVEDICKLLCESKNLELLINLFNSVSNIDLNDKSKDYIKTFALLNKYFMIVFNRINNNLPSLFEGNEQLYENINNSIEKNWESVKHIMKDSTESEENIASFVNGFKEYFSSYVDLIDKNVAIKGVNSINANVLKYTLNMLLEAVKFFQLDEKANYAASRMLKIANKVAHSDDEVKVLLEKLFVYLKGIVNTSEFPKTLANILEVLLGVLTREEAFGSMNPGHPNGSQFNPSTENPNATMKEQILSVVLNFMNTKPKIRMANFFNLSILELIMAGNNFMEQYFKTLHKNYNLVNPIISVMARHLYDSSTVLKVVKTSETQSDSQQNLDDVLPDENLENTINTQGAKLLEKLVDVTEFKKMIKSFKDNVSSFNVANASMDTITNLEFNLLYFFAILKIKNYFSTGLSDILEALKQLLRKEISYIEAFKRDKNNEKNEKFGEIVSSSSKRLNLQIAILKLLNDNCNKSFEETQNKAYISPLKEVINSILEIFEKSSDSTNLIDLLSHMQKNIEFLLENEASLSLDQGNKKQTGKFEDSIVEKITNVLMNLLRKTPDDEALAESIIRTFVKLTQHKPDTCNFLVKAGCSRLLLQIVENTSNVKLAKQAMDLIKIISLSGEENLTMVSNQNILEKLHEIHTKFANDEEITNMCDTITNELIKLPGQEETISEIIKSNIDELHQNMQNTSMDTPNGKLSVLINLEKINAFSSNKKQIEVLNNQSFMSDLQVAINNTLADKEVTDINEKLLQNEISLLRKINDDIKSYPLRDEDKTGGIIDSVLALMKEKSHFRDIYLTAARMISDYISDDEVFATHLKDKLDSAFVDSLFETSENYIDDVEVTKEINNILCNLCLRSDSLAEYIVQKGGLINVMEELKSLVSLNDEASKNMKLNGLKFLHSLVKDPANMEKFLKANGADLINNLLKNEVNNLVSPRDFQSNPKLYYLTNDTFNVINTADKTDRRNKEINLALGISNPNTQNTNPHLVFCFKIINENNKQKLNTFHDPKLFRYILSILDCNYPSKMLFKKGIKLINNAFLLGEIDVEDKKLLNQIILSNVAYFLTDKKVNKLGKNILEKEILLYNQDDFFIQLLNDKYSFGEHSANYSEIVKFLTYSALSAVLNVNKSAQNTNVQEALFDFYKYILNFYNTSGNATNKVYQCNEGVALALLKLSKHFVKKKTIDLSSANQLDLVSKLINISLNYYKPTSHHYVQKFLKEFKKIFKHLGNKDFNDKFTEDYVFFLQNIYLRSFDFLDHYGLALLNNNGIVNNIHPLVEQNLNQIIEDIITYYKIDQDADIKVSSLRKLAASCLSLLGNDKLSLNNPNVYERVRSIWEILYNVTNKDINNVICGNEEVVTAILEKLAETISKHSEDALLRNFYKLISSKLENNIDLFEKIVEFIGKDMEENKDKNPELCLIPDLEVLNNLSKFPIIPKILLKNSNGIFDTLKQLHSSTTTDPNVRAILSGIFKSLLGNNLNNEVIIEQHPEVVKSLINSMIGNKAVVNSEAGREAARNEVDAFVALLNDNYNQVVKDKQLITEDDLLKAVEIYNGDEELGGKLTALQKQISEINISRQAEENLKKDTESSKTVCDYVKEMFEQHMRELQTFKNESTLRPADTLTRNSTKMLTTQSAVAKISSAPQSKMSMISKTLFYNTDNFKIKSPLSCKDNCDIPQTLDQILNLLRKLYNEARGETDQNVHSEKTSLILNLIQALKALSISPDNHKTILEMGLMNFLEKLIQDPHKPVKLYIETLDVCKNCTYSEGSIPVFLESNAAEPIVYEVLHLYEKPELITHNLEVKQLFFFSNMIFSNLCRSKKGFSFLYNKIGLDKLLSIGKRTSHVDILTAIVEMLVNYIQNHSKQEISPMIKEILLILGKCLTLNNKTSKLISGCLILCGSIYSQEMIEGLARLELVKAIYKEFDKFSAEPDFLNAVLFCLGKITVNNVNCSRDVLDTGLLNKLKEITQTPTGSDLIIENITSLYKNLVLNNLENIEKFCKFGIVINVFFCLETYWDKSNTVAPSVPHSQTYMGQGPLPTQAKATAEGVAQSLSSLNSASQIVLNCVQCLDSMTISDKAIAYLADTKFPTLIFDTIEKKQNEIEIVKFALHCVGNYLYKEVGNNLKSINFERILQILITLQKKYYSNSDVLININYIAGYLIKTVKDKVIKEKLYMIISSSLKMQDWNIPLIIMTLKLMLDIITGNVSLIDDVFEDNMQCLFNLLKLYKDNIDIQMYCYRIFSLFGKNYIYSYTMVNAGLIDFIKDTLESDPANDIKTRHQIREVVYSLLSVLSNDTNNAKKISDVVLDKLIKDLNSDEFDQELSNIIKLVWALSKHKHCIEPFIQYNGLEALLKVLKDNTTNLGILFDCFYTLGNIVADGHDEYKRMMKSMNVPDLINNIINSSGHLDKKIEFEGRTLIFAINNTKLKLDEVEDLNYVDIKVENPIKTDVKNFLASGKIVKM